MCGSNIPIQEVNVKGGGGIGQHNEQVGAKGVTRFSFKVQNCVAFTVFLFLYVFFAFCFGFSTVGSSHRLKWVHGVTKYSKKCNV